MTENQRPSSGDTPDRQWRGDPSPAADPAVSPTSLEELFGAACAPATPRELAGEQAAVAAFIALGPGVSGSPSHTRNRARRLPVLSTLLASKLAAAAAAGGLVLTGTAAAAYTGALPSGLQNLAHQAIGAPAAAPTAEADATPQSDPTTTADPTTDPTSSPTSEPTSTATASGPDATGKAAFGLCTAFTHGGLATTSVAYRSLAQAAGGPANIAAYCATVAAPAPAVTAHPTGAPTAHPTGAPTGRPSSAPTSHRTGTPASVPTHPGGSPTPHPGGSPTSHPGR